MELGVGVLIFLVIHGVVLWGAYKRDRHRTELEIQWLRERATKLEAAVADLRLAAER